MIAASVSFVPSQWHHANVLFPPSIAPGVMDRLARAGVPASYVEIDTELGHVASGPEWAAWGPRLRSFLEGLRR